MVKIGDYVTFVDAVAVEHPALLTQVWGHGDESPSVNLVFVADDESKMDNYGRQIVRHTSVVHQRNQSAHGMFWK